MKLKTVRSPLLTQCRSSPTLFHLFSERISQVASTGSESEDQDHAFRCGGWNDTDLKGAVMIYDGPADLLAHYDESLLVKGI